MIYDIAGMRIQIENQYDFTTKFCQAFLSEDQDSAVDLVARVTEEEFETEKAQSPGFSDGYIENICLYRSICLQIPMKNRILLHASVIKYDGNGYAFLGRSGTGKSTHTRLWMQNLPTTRIVNGDKPILEYDGEKFIAYGTPWCGKEHWGSKGNAPLRGLCFLEQAKENSVRKLTPAEVSSRLFQQILLPTEEDSAVATLELADKLIACTPAYLLGCDISEEAVKTSFEALTGKKYKSENE